MSHFAIPPLLRRWIAGVLAALIGLGPMLSAYAAVTPLADEPLNTKNSARPNIVLTVDDSTSMLFDFLPDYVASNYCRGGLGGMTAACGNIGAANDFTAVGGGKYFSPGYTYQQFSYPYTQYTGAASYDASGPGAGCYPGAPPTCSPGVNPGPLPGLAVYPAGPQPSWPNGNKPYEYWLLWPAPPHSSALNALYYDPRITYDPPVDSTGASYVQMDAAGSTNWTKVPGDPWAASVTNVDLTTSVNVGLWCNSDWSLGLVTTDPADANYGKYCRTNGSGAAAFGTVTAAQGADYTYPWAPPGFTLSASPGATTANTYAAQKVTLNATLTGTAITAAWNATTQNSKFFYENENIIWCDPTSPSWPQTGPVTSQVCANVKLQTCSAIAQVCNKAPGACNNYIAPKCNGVVVGVCNGTNPAACNGTPAVCNNAPTCNNPGCGNIRPDICVGTAQSCPTSPQTCSGPFAQVCNLPNTQTCQPPVCNVTYNPPGCNLLPPDPENPCNPVTTCAPPVCTPDPGTCNITHASCTAANAAAVCVPQPGACSISGASCMAQANCPNLGHCSVTAGLCQTVSDCPIQGGHCSRNAGKACTQNTDCNSGNCSNASGATAGRVCLVPSDCFYCSTGAMQACPLGVGQCTPGSCSQRLCPDGQTPCTTNANCVGIGSGICQAAAGCTSSATCPVKNGTCAFGGNGCTTSGQCSATPGQCNRQNGQPWSQKPCTGNAQCLTLGTCNVGGAACASDPNGCPEQLGTCAKDASVTCRSANDCSSVGTCANTHAACNSKVPCANLPGVCSLSGLACTTIGTDPICLPTGACSVTGAQCTCPFGTGAGGSCASPSCPQQPGPLPPNAATCSTTGVGGNAAVTLRHDAETNGVVCRRNNQTSGGAAYSSGAADYPSGKFLTPITAGVGADACPATDHFAAVPRHYWKSEVQWCDKKIATAGDQWLGYGTDVGGTCQPGKDSTHIYPRFFKFGSPVYVDNYGTAAFQRVDLDTVKKPSYTHNWIDVNGQPQTITRTFDQEMTNYANWFAYYRTRIQAVKTVTSLTFTVLDDQYRVGFHTLSNGLTTSTGQFDPAKFVDVQDFTSGQKATWFGELFNITIPLRLETPTLDAMKRIGDYYSPGGSAQLSGSTDPIILSCQKNWHMLFTDGFTNQGPPTSLPTPDQDNTVLALPDPVVGLTVGNPWPHPFREDPSGAAGNAASDYAMNYWVTDLRPGGPNGQDNVPATAKDPAIWQHLNFAALSLGTQGKLPIANQSLTENLLAAGTLQWPQPIPTVNKPDNSGVDDLWHAAINGRGRFVNASTAAELKLGMGQILQDITNQAGARAGAGFSSSSISLTNNAVYIVTFQPGWAGTLSKVSIDPVTGIESNVPIWEAATQLSAQLTPTVANPTPWFTNRNIFTVKDNGSGGPGNPVPFLWPKLSGAQQDSLAPGQPAIGQAVLEFLRGNPTNEGVGAGQFRVRGTGPNGGEDFLGDIVDSQAVYVGPPNSPYNDSTDPGYSGYASTFQGRPARIYVGANDGMVHAFDDATGNESWAFVPHDLYRPDATGLGALSYQDGALPPFRHHFLVDSTPRAWDVNFGSGPSDWHTVLIGGLGKGGKSYYALDVTDPASVTDEGSAANQYLWTFTDPDMGYTFGRPFLTKTHATVAPFVDGQWVAVVAAGYNNVDTGCVQCGQGKIFFIDARTGAKLKEMSTGFGDSTNPAGLAQVIGYTKDFHNQLAEQIYGGDLYGNFWRFDVQDPDPANWTVHQLAYLTDPNGTPQPITAKPATDVDITNGVDRWVFVGTGRLLDETDLTNASIATQQQTLYAIRDGTATTPNPFTVTLQPRADFVPLTDTVAGLTAKPSKGWYQDLPAGQRVVTPVVAALSLVAYAGTEAQDNPCLTGEPAVLYVRSFAIGETLLPGATAATAGGLDEPAGAVGLAVTIFSDAAGVQSAGGLDIRVGVTTAAGTIVFQTTITQSGLGMNRMSWRLFGQ